MKTTLHWLGILEFPFTFFFVLMTMIGLTKSLSEAKIDPLPMQVASILLLVILGIRLAVKLISELLKGNRLPEN